jgi:hypothetical protein
MNTFKMNLQHFADGGEPDITPDNTPDDGAKPDDNKPEKEDKQPGVKKVEMTQDELDMLIQKRVDRVQKKYSDYDDLKSKLSQFEKAEQDRKKAEMNEIDRLKLEKEEAEKTAIDNLSKANARLIKSEFKLVAKELGIRADALEDAFKLADLSSVQVDDDGAVEGVKGVVDALIQAKPYLAEQVKKEPKTIGGSSNPTPDSTAKTAEQLLKEAAEKAKRTGRMDDRAAYAALKRELGY